MKRLSQSGSSNFCPESRKNAVLISQSHFSNFALHVINYYIVIIVIIIDIERSSSNALCTCLIVLLLISYMNRAIYTVIQ